ncbi:MAG TPA: hypothetical protein VMX97_02915 [Hyphomicrobiaceae bacterium]|nr:hypothetical protein [Hyphomicrobiaceae bacterium]
MATGYINLFPGGIAPDGSGTVNNTAALSYEVSAATQTSNTPKATQLKLLFDGTTDEHWLFSFLLPGDYSSGGTLRGKAKFTTATTGTAVMKGGQVTSVDGSTDDDALVFAAGDVSSAISAPGTQGWTVGFTIALTATNMAANRKIVVFIGRDPDNGSDDITTDLELLALNFEYTTA